MGALKATHNGVLSLGKIHLECHVLEGGKRVFSSRDLLNAFNLSSEQQNQSRVLASFLSRIRLNSLSDKELANHLSAPVHFTQKGRGGKPSYGYLAELLPEICSSVLELESNLKLPIEYRPAAKQSRALLKAFAKIGIIALVDEATGYQEARDRNALQEILDKYLRKEHAAWAKRFPDEFYMEMFRLKGWEWKGMKVNRPSVVGTYTNDIVYNRLAPGVLKELQSKNPPVGNGKRVVKHHQWLTDDIGHPALSYHLFALIALMKTSTDWKQFHRNLKRAFPVLGDQLEFNIEKEDN